MSRGRQTRSLSASDEPTGSRRFRYRDEGNPPRPRPTIDVDLRLAPNGHWRTSALIDTGSPITVFDHGSAEALLVRFNQAGAEMGSIAILGAMRTVQFEYIDMSLVADPTFHWEARVGFITDPTFEMAFQGLLGTDGFLNKWAVTFNAYYDYFALSRADESPA